MIIETKDGKNIKITKPAGCKDSLKIVAASIAVDDREYSIDMDEKINKGAKTIILGNTERTLEAPNSMELNENVSIKLENNKSKEDKERDLGE